MHEDPLKKVTGAATSPEVCLSPKRYGCDRKSSVKWQRSSFINKTLGCITRSKSLMLLLWQHVAVFLAVSEDAWKTVYNINPCGELYINLVFFISHNGKIKIKMLSHSLLQKELSFILHSRSASMYSSGCCCFAP